MRPPPRAKIGLVQMCSRNDKEKNFQECRRLLDEAVALGCHLVAFPENFAFIGARPGETQAAAELLSGELMGRYRELARERRVWLSLGGFQERPEVEDADGKFYNTHVIVDAAGEIVAAYRKIHLFDMPAAGPVFMESTRTLAGKEVVSCDSPVGRLGLTVCYDVRFPELYQVLRFGRGCEVLLVPAAFTMKTGEAHWELLLRARAVECECYVVAAAQAGLHDEEGSRRMSWGHGLAVDPWGKVIAQMDGTENGVRAVEVDSTLIAKTRQDMPLDLHRRYEVYGPGAANL